MFPNSTFAPDGAQCSLHSVSDYPYRRPQCSCEGKDGRCYNDRGIHLESGVIAPSACPAGAPSTYPMPLLVLPILCSSREDIIMNPQPGVHLSLHNDARVAGEKAGESNLRAKGIALSSGLTQCKALYGNKLCAHQHHHYPLGTLTPIKAQTEHRNSKKKQLKYN